MRKKNRSTCTTEKHGSTKVELHATDDVVSGCAKSVVVGSTVDTNTGRAETIAGQPQSPCENKVLRKVFLLTFII